MEFLARNLTTRLALLGQSKLVTDINTVLLVALLIVFLAMLIALLYLLKRQQNLPSSASTTSAATNADTDANNPQNSSFALTKALMEEQISRNNQTQNQLWQAGLQNQLAPLAQNLKQLNEQLLLLQQNRQKQQGFLESQLRNLQQTNSEVLKSTQDLGGALRNSRTRGFWGEIELRRIFEVSGLSKHIDFSEQTVVQNSAGQTLRPDAIVHLPDNHQIVIDAKVPMDAYLQAQAVRATGPEAEAKQQEILQAHAKALSQHVDALAKREYGQTIKGSADFVVLFLPAETLLSSALDADPTLLERSLRLGVCLATPASLLALLRTVQATWALAQTQSEASKILDLGSELVSRLSKVSLATEQVGKDLAKTVSDYNRLVSSFEARLLPAARKLEAVTNAQMRQNLELNQLDDVFVRPVKTDQ